jgi:signal transduction histidine kinase
MRWWFLALCGLIVAAVAVSAHRIRVARAVAMERVRTRIATDLHDDIGASLSQIAIHSELLRRRVDGEDASTRSRLSRIAGDARELVDSMADIVWAIDPKRDRLGDVVVRMRRFANDTAGASEIACTFHGPSRGDDLALGPNLRRQIFLIFKESVNNAVRHSGCGRLEISFGVESDRLVLEVADDGDGFDIGRKSDGHGLASMKRRAEALGGSFRVESRPGEGTRLQIEIPVGRGNRG